MFGLDTNIVISAINLRPIHIRARLDAELASRSPIGIPSIVIYEMRYGAAKSNRRAGSEASFNAFLSLPVTPWAFDAEDVVHAGNIRAELESAGTPIGHYDYLIAAQARRRGVALVTLNRREFDRVPGLVVVDWTA